MKRTALAMAASLAALLCAHGRDARGDEPVASATTWLPGDARALVRSTSASRDAAVFEYAYGPRAQGSIGAEPGLLRIDGRETVLRVGLYALAALENVSNNRVFPPSELWRGLIGVSAALEVPRLARAWLVPGSTMELSLVVGHESDHETVGPIFLPASGPSVIPYGGGGDFIAPDVAVRFPLGRTVAITLRLQDRIYFNELSLIFGGRSASSSVAESLHEGLANAPGADLIVRWRATRRTQPQLAIFGEHLFAHDGVVPDGGFLRAMAGVVFPGRVGEVEPFVSLDGGNGKGLLIEQRQLRFSAGVRYALF